MQSSEEQTLLLGTRSPRSNSDIENGAIWMETNPTIMTSEETKKGKAGKKEESGKKKKDDDLKTHMANERTFFKWLFTGFHIGAMGTFILAFFSESRDPYKLLLVIFCWLIALSFVLYGLYNYYRRRRALRMGLKESTEWDAPHGPAFVVAGLVLVIASVIIYAIYTGVEPRKPNNFKGF
ncbi:hypothetical protein GpartN1_g6902.t1 [Galdieria partita]|uniref:DUF202 domain-containing protein n=1 Tax=Galdieria partita TaxID=83374 RepID=A0A9C7Q2P6_9RHOD|nr:hypothetical protein GpartN1_g6902.t1 [Galdieria partita]